MNAILTNRHMKKNVLPRASPGGMSVFTCAIKKLMPPTAKQYHTSDQLELFVWKRSPIQDTTKEPPLPSGVRGLGAGNKKMAITSGDWRVHKASKPQNLPQLKNCGANKGAEKKPCTTKYSAYSMHVLKTMLPIFLGFINAKFRFVAAGIMMVLRQMISGSDLQFDIFNVGISLSKAPRGRNRGHPRTHNEDEDGEEVGGRVWQGRKCKAKEHVVLCI